MGVDVAETVTDAHVQISSLMSKIMLKVCQESRPAKTTIGYKRL